jgi:pimeloyl-ACP methyl ester carboxylesterase
MDDWGEFVGSIGDAIELAALDLPGFGKSETLSGCETTLLDAYADCIHAAAAGLGWRTGYYLAGHSHGAGVAMTMAARYPESIAGLVLLASIGVPAHAAYRQLTLPGVHRALRLASGLLSTATGRKLMSAAVGNILSPMFHPVPVSTDAIAEQMSRFVERPEILATMATLARGDPAGQLSRDATRIRAPSLFLHGDEDRVIPASHARALSSLLAGVAPTTFDLVPRAGHMLHRTHAEHAARRTLEWLEER